MELLQIDLKNNLRGGDDGRGLQQDLVPVFVGELVGKCGSVNSADDGAVVDWATVRSSSMSFGNVGTERCLEERYSGSWAWVLTDHSAMRRRGTGSRAW